jgi:hypothetical protein
VTGLWDARLASVLAGALPGLGLSLRSDKPLAGEEMLRLGSGALGAGRYALAARATVLDGAVAVALIEAETGARLAAVTLSGGEPSGAAEVEIGAERTVAVVLAAANAAAPSPVAATLDEIGLRRLTPGGPQRAATPPAGTRLTHLWDPRLGPALAGGMPGLGMRLQSTKPLAGEEMLQLGRGLLPAGRYRLAAEATVLAGAISLGARDAATLQCFAPPALVTALGGGAALDFALARPAEVAIAVSAANMQAAGPVDALLGALDLRLLEAPADLDAFLTERGSTRALADLLADPEYRDPRLPAVPTAFDLEACASEYLLVGRPTERAAGIYELAAEVACARGRIAVGLVGEGDAGWIAQLVLEPGRRWDACAVRLAAPTRARLVVVAANAAPGPLAASLRALALARLGTDAAP